MTQGYDQKPRKQPVGRFGYAVTMLLVSWLSLLLLTYVGFGEAQRTYRQFQIEKLQAQGQIIQNAMAPYLRSGLPIRQYVGFSVRADAVLASDESVAGIAVLDPDGRSIFSAGQDDIELISEVLEHAETDGDHGYEEGLANRVDARSTDEFLQVVLPLRNKFELVGQLLVTQPQSVSTGFLEAKFETLLVVSVFLSVAFSWFATVIGPRLANQRTPWLEIGYAVSFAAMAILVIFTMVSAYSEGAQSKTRALANSLGQRMHDIVVFNLNLGEFEGLDKAFSEYQRLNPDIEAAALIVDGAVVIHSDRSRIGEPWEVDQRAFEYNVDISNRQASAKEVHIAVETPAEVVYERVTRSVKNFAVLFVACAFLAGLFLQLVRSLQRKRWLDSAKAHLEVERLRKYNAALSFVKPVFFLAVFVEHLTYSFLPQFIQEAALRAGLSEGFASAPFMIYYLCFALTLVPSGHWSRQIGPRILMYMGLALASGGLLSLAVTDDFYLLTAMRAVAGIGQGMLFIGVQCYILDQVSQDKQTQGASVIVFGFQGGMISGLAIGSLLVSYIGQQGVFHLAGAIALALTLYAMFIVPNAAGSTHKSEGFETDLRRLASNIHRLVQNADFLRTMFLIGVPAKAVMTGAVTFALPLILARREFEQEEIGQIIMLYAAGVLLAGFWVSRFVDRTGRTSTILFLGAILSSVGLFVIGISDARAGLIADPQSFLSSTLLVTGVALVGMGHGFINAPVITHVARSALAKTIGANSVAASYRFLERVGHIAGPIVFGQLFLLMGQNATVMIWIAVIVLFGALLFVSRPAPLQPLAPGEEKR